MERGLFRRIKATLRALGRRRANGRFAFTDATILEVYLRAALHDRPTCWACDPEHWPPRARRGELPSASTVSRRMRTPSVLDLLERLRERLDPRDGGELVAIVDGKALVIGPHSHDRQSGYGRAVNGLGRGYKLHAIVDAMGRLLSWRLAPMQADESRMARRMLGELGGVAYLLGDSSYDKNHLYDAALERGIELRAPRRSARGTPLGHRRHSPARVRSRDMLEVGEHAFGRGLMRQRWAVERYFGALCASPGGLGHLPAWARGYRRVRNWVAAKLAIQAARRGLRREGLMQ